MRDIFKLLNANTQEAIKILLTKENNTIEFANWDKELECYIPNDGAPYAADEACPWIRFANDDGYITTQMVVAARYNEAKRIIEIKTTERSTEESDGVFFDMAWGDDISYWSVLSYIGNYK